MALRYKYSKSPELRAEAVARVMRWVLAGISAEKKTAISVGGSECGHAACGGSETIILLTRAGEQTIRLKIAKPLETVTQAEIADALASPVAGEEIL